MISIATFIVRGVRDWVYKTNCGEKYYDFICIKWLIYIRIDELLIRPYYIQGDYTLSLEPATDC